MGKVKKRSVFRGFSLTRLLQVKNNDEFQSKETLPSGTRRAQLLKMSLFSLSFEFNVESQVAIRYGCRYANSGKVGGTSNGGRQKENYRQVSALQFVTTATRKVAI